MIHPAPPEAPVRQPLAPPAAPPAWRFWAALAVKFAVVLAVPLPLLAAYTGGKTIELKAAPYDPVDVLRGRYLSLTCDIGLPDNVKRLPGFQPAWSNGSHALYWTLAPDTLGKHWGAVAIGDTLPTPLPAGEIALAGRLTEGRGTFGLEQYYFPDAKAAQVQTALGSHLDIYTTVKVDAHGKGVLTGIRIGSQRF